MREDHSDSSIEKPGGGAERETVWIRKDLFESLVRVCVDALPRKAYGLVGGLDAHRPLNLYPCSSNLRDTPEWAKMFDAFGEFYQDPDRGFVLAPDEYLAVMEMMATRGESLVGVFHSHRCRRAEPSVADMALSRGPELLWYIVSVVNRDEPEVGIFRLFKTRYEEVRFAIL